MREREQMNQWSREWRGRYGDWISNRDESQCTVSYISLPDVATNFGYCHGRWSLSHTNAVMLAVTYLPPSNSREREREGPRKKKKVQTSEKWRVAQGGWWWQEKRRSK